MQDSQASTVLDWLRRPARVSPRILVVGDGILDQFVYGSARRVSPEAPVPIVNAAYERYYPGGAANVMANLAELGADVLGLAVVGPDSNSVRLRELLDSGGVRTDEFVLQSDWQTPRKCRMVADGRHALRVDYERECRIDPATFDRLSRAAARLIPDCDVVVMSDYAKGTLTSRLIQTVIATANDHRRLVIVDPKGGDASRYACASVLTPNEAETELLTGIQIHDERTLARAAATLRRTTAADWIIVTRSEHGVAVSGDTLTLVPPRTVRARDVSGAGDTMVAALAFGMAVGASVLDSAQIANLAAACAVERPGIATISREELLRASEQTGSSPRHRLHHEGIEPICGVGALNSSGSEP